MTITRRNRLRRHIASILAERAGCEAVRQHIDTVAAMPEGRHYTRCCDHAYEDAARNAYHHLADSRVYRGRLGIGLPELQSRLGEERLTAPPPGWEDRAVERAKREGVLR